MTRAALFIGQALDAATFALFFAVVPAALLAGQTERNPIVATLFALGGYMAVVVVKVGGTSLVLWRDHQRKAQRPRKTGAVMWLAAGSGFVGCAFNTVALWTVLSLA